MLFEKSNCVPRVLRRVFQSWLGEPVLHHGYARFQRERSAGLSVRNPIRRIGFGVGIAYSSKETGISAFGLVIWRFRSVHVPVRTSVEFTNRREEASEDGIILSCRKQLTPSILHPDCRRGLQESEQEMLKNQPNTESNETWKPDCETELINYCGACDVASACPGATFSHIHRTERGLDRG